MTTLDEAPIVTIENPVEYERETTEEAVHPRQWVRFWARMFDYSLFFLVMGLILRTFAFRIMMMGGSIYLMICLFLWVFIEAFLLSTWGTTPGKWLLRTSIRSSNYQKLTFSDALNRSFSVWWLGMGAGLPIVFVITMIVASVKLSNMGQTTWDRRNDYHIKHRKVGTARTVIIILYFLCYFFLFLF